MKKQKKKNVKQIKAEDIFLITIFIICFCVATYSGIRIIQWFLNNKQNSEIIETISSKISLDTIENEKGKYNIDFEGLKEINSDTVGWLKVYGTDVEFPVVQSIDNKYYLTHNFQKKNNKAGWIFADFNNKFDGTDKNIVIYGHNRRDGSMFATLKNILNREWCENDANRMVIFITPNEYSLYEVFSVYQIIEEDYYITTNFENYSYSDFIKRAKSKSIYDFGIDVFQEDSILTLSTCADNSKYRIVLQAKKIAD